MPCSAPVVDPSSSGAVRHENPSSNARGVGTLRANVRTGRPAGPPSGRGATQNHRSHSAGRPRFWESYELTPGAHPGCRATLRALMADRDDSERHTAIAQAIDGFVSAVQSFDQQGHRGVEMLSRRGEPTGHRRTWMCQIKQHRLQIGIVELRHHLGTLPVSGHIGAVARRIGIDGTRDDAI
jgi:hypothetical protein